jgi:hypothetical protein
MAQQQQHSLAVVAIVHSEGVLLKKENYKSYYALELAYIDIEGMIKKFLIKSPMNQAEALSKYDKATIERSQDVIMCTSDEWCGLRTYSYWQVLQFLRSRYFHFRARYRNSVFSYKGAFFQSKILKHAGIHRVNLEDFGCPSLRLLNQSFGSHLLATFPGTQYCPFHPKGRPCALSKALLFRMWCVHYSL